MTTEEGIIRRARRVAERVVTNAEPCTCDEARGVPCLFHYAQLPTPKKLTARRIAGVDVDSALDASTRPIPRGARERAGTWGESYTAPRRGYGR